ncbi:MAG: hypothetical protein RLZZ563_1771 [Pseudomonadota bacterium]
MAREIPDLQAAVRTGTGKGAARQARREGYVPGIVYGDGKEPSPINLNYNYLLKRLRQGRFLQTLFNLKVEGGEEVHVICRGVQRDVVKDLPTHVDFMRIHDESRINLFIHVTFENHDAAPGIKRGGKLPDYWRGCYSVIDGDKHDLRFLPNEQGELRISDYFPEGSREGNVIGLRAKGKAVGVVAHHESFIQPYSDDRP